MKTETNPAGTELSALNSVLPVEMLARLGIEEYLDQLGHAAAPAAGERQRLGELLLAAEQITSKNLDDAFSGQRKDSRKLGAIPIEKGVMTQRETEVVLEYQRRQDGVGSASRGFALGNILVASGEITRLQLEGALLRQVESGRRLGEELIKVGDASKGQVEGGLLLQRKLVACALAITVGLAPLATYAPEAEAAQKSAAMQVSVSVIANAKMQTAFQATQLSISAADVARGYVEIAAASRFSVATNSRTGYRLEFQPIGNVFESVQVGGFGNLVQLGADGGSVVQRGPFAPNLEHELSFRFTLHPQTLPGSYPWPLQMSVRALA
jgi:hypothetical protein